jgi:hypothetical protein
MVVFLYLIIALVVVTAFVGAMLYFTRSGAAAKVEQRVEEGQPLGRSWTKRSRPPNA